MTDVGSHRFVKSSAKSDRVLVPQPSDDPHDPLVTVCLVLWWCLVSLPNSVRLTWIPELETFLEILMPHLRCSCDIRAGNGPFIVGSNVRSTFAIESFLRNAQSPDHSKFARDTVYRGGKLYYDGCSLIRSVHQLPRLKCRPFGLRGYL